MQKRSIQRNLRSLIVLIGIIQMLILPSVLASGISINTDDLTAGDKWHYNITGYTTSGETPSSTVERNVEYIGLEEISLVHYLGTYNCHRFETIFTDTANTEFARNFTLYIDTTNYQRIKVIDSVNSSDYDSLLIQEFYLPNPISVLPYTMDMYVSFLRNQTFDYKKWTSSGLTTDFVQNQINLTIIGQAESTINLDIGNFDVVEVKKVITLDGFVQRVEKEKYAESAGVNPVYMNVTQFTAQGPQNTIHELVDYCNVNHPDCSDDDSPFELNGYHFNLIFGLSCLGIIMKWKKITKKSK